MSHGFKFFVDPCYLGGYIGDDKSKQDWIKDRTEELDINIRAVTKTAVKYHQESYAAVVCAIHQSISFFNA